MVDLHNTWVDVLLESHEKGSVKIGNKKSWGYSEQTWDYGILWRHPRTIGLVYDHSGIHTQFLNLVTFW